VWGERETKREAEEKDADSGKSQRQTHAQGRSDRRRSESLKGGRARQSTESAAVAIAVNPDGLRENSFLKRISGKELVTERGWHRLNGETTRLQTEKKRGSENVSFERRSRCTLGTTPNRQRKARTSGAAEGGKSFKRGRKNIIEHVPLGIETGKVPLSRVGNSPDYLSKKNSGERPAGQIN